MLELRKYALQRLARAVERLETELLRLDESGIFVALQKPAVSNAGGAYFRTIRVQTTAAMQSGIAFGMTVDFDVMRLQRANTYLVIREEQHFRASVFGEGELARYESGHRTHKQHPHVHGTWCREHLLPEPRIQTQRPMSLTRFVVAIELWRSENAMYLPPEPPPLGPIRA
ncbi:MAG: hypothetical protein HEQ38_02400 [Gemmatimonas sp.]|nr:hypothetical protein [Gemmatimonas sp.]